MRKTRISLMLVVILALSAIPFSLFIVSVTGSTTTLPDYEPLRLSAGFRNRELPIVGARSSAIKTAGGLHSSASPYYEVGDLQWWLSLDDYYGYYYWSVFELRANNSLAEIWVQTNLSYGWDADGNTWFDPRADPVVSQEDIDYLLGEFTNNIYPKDTAAFGTPDTHDGTNAALSPDDYSGSSREVILIHNFKDYAYYDPEYPYYIAGFYSPSFEFYFDRNIINIDSHDWENRIGPGVSRPYLYESVIAHEYQHLIHDDYNPYDDIWMNEACSMFAEFLCDYPVDYSAIESFLWTPDNSLTEWGDQTDLNILADYGAVFLWAMYLYDHFGGDAFLSRFVTAGIPGIEGINQALAYFGYSMTFDDVFHNWRIANLIHSDKPGHGKYNYQSLDISGLITMVHQAPKNKVVSGSDFGETFSILDNPTGVTLLGTYGTDYVLINKLKNLNFIFFEGDSEATFPHWVQVDGMWYSGESDLMDTLISTEVYVEESDPWLYLNTYWDIEDFWDYGFIQVSTDNGVNWISLANEFTNDTYANGAHPDIIANMPGLTSWSVFYDMEEPYDGVIPMKFNLTEYVGQTVQIGFRYMTDWAFTYEGWYILGANVGSNNIMDTLQLKDWIPDVSWMVSVVERRTYKHRGRTYTKYSVHDMYMWDETNGIDLAFLSHKEELILVISPMMAKGTADYSFKTVPLGRRWHSW
ncbi:MAG: hypothetical protein ACTSR1_06385, partial [Candidatus Heimdallarchaeota archaeon]